MPLATMCLLFLYKALCIKWILYLFVYITTYMGRGILWQGVVFGFAEKILFYNCCCMLTNLFSSIMEVTFNAMQQKCTWLIYLDFYLLQHLKAFSFHKSTIYSHKILSSWHAECKLIKSLHCCLPVGGLCSYFSLNKFRSSSIWFWVGVCTLIGIFNNVSLSNSLI